LAKAELLNSLRISTIKKIIIAFGKAEKMFMFPDAFKSGFLNLQ